MAYTLEEVNGCTKKLVFNFESLDLSKEIAEALKEKQKTVSLKGFRKGKAPLDMVEKFYRPQVESDAINRFVQAQLYEAITAEDLRVVGYPAFENMKYDGTDKISFDAIVEIFPEVSIGDLSKLSFSKEAVEVTDEEFENSVKQYLAPKAEMKELEGATLATGHSAVLNFQGVMEDGTRPENMKGEEFVLEIGSGQFIPGFEDGMVGMKAGDKKDIALTFPAEYHAEDLQNAKVTFEVELLEVKEKVLPELTDELAKEFGYESVEDFKTKTRTAMVDRKEREAQEKLNQKILEKLIEENPFDVPAALLNQQKDHLRSDLSNQLKQQGFNDSMLDDYFSKWDDDMNQKAQFQVKSGLILDTLAKKYEVSTSDSDVEDKIKEMAEKSGLDLEQVKGYYNSSPDLKKNLTFALREEKTFAKVLEEVKLS